MKAVWVFHTGARQWARPRAASQHGKHRQLLIGRRLISMVTLTDFWDFPSTTRAQCHEAGSPSRRPKRASIGNEKGAVARAPQAGRATGLAGKVWADHRGKISLCSLKGTAGNQRASAPRRFRIAIADFRFTDKQPSRWDGVLKHRRITNGSTRLGRAAVLEAEKNAAPRAENGTAHRRGRAAGNRQWRARIENVA